MKENKFVMFISIIVGIIALVVCGIIFANQQKREEKSDTTIEKLVKDIKVEKKELVKGSISLEKMDLYDELPDINKYPLSVEGNADIVVEVFSSNEKAGNNKSDSWIIDVAKEFNNSNQTVNGKSVAVSIRNITSGLGGDYIISGKYIPEMWTPSNELSKLYVETNGKNFETIQERLVGNTAGIIISKGKYKDFDSIINDISKGKVKFGYTNPQSSATGLNLLLSLLNTYDKKNIFSDNSVNKFKEFQNNILYMAENTIQMRNSMQNGSLDGMVMEYQSYINDKNLKSVYDFIPFGIRHNNPLYATEKAIANPEKLEACKLFGNFCISEKMQKLASNKGFNEKDEYNSSYSVTGAEITKALKLYKDNKNSDKKIIACFVADRSGSMSGEPLNKLKTSLSNSIQYINENNMVGLVSYSSDITIDLPIANFDLDQKAYFQGALNNITDGGNTLSYDACVVAIDMVQKAMKDNPNSKGLIILLSDGKASSVGLSLNNIDKAVKKTNIPIYTIAYTNDADKDELGKLSELNEATCISAESDDIIYKLKSLFNSQL